MDMHLRPVLFANVPGAQQSACQCPDAPERRRACIQVIPPIEVEVFHRSADRTDPFPPGDLSLGLQNTG